MQPTTVNKGPFIRDWLTDSAKVPPFEEFERVRIGRKQYGFRHKCHLVMFTQVYQCSWPEADRRFKMHLITLKMLK